MRSHVDSAKEHNYSLSKVQKSILEQGERKMSARQILLNVLKNKCNRCGSVEIILCANCNRIKVYKNHENYIWKIKA